MKNNILLVTLGTGVTIIGHVTKEKKKFIIEQPMYLITGDDGVRMQDALLLSADDYMVIDESSIITILTPINILEEYYKKIVLFSEKYTNPMIYAQVYTAIENLTELLSQNVNSYKDFLQTTPLVSNTFH